MVGRQGIGGRRGVGEERSKNIPSSRKPSYPQLSQNKHNNEHEEEW